METPKYFYFNQKHAEKYGLKEAIILHNIIYWTSKNRRDSRAGQGAEDKFRDGKWWMYDSVREFSDRITFLSPKQIRDAIKSLREQEVIIAGNYHKDKTKMSNWYAVIDEALLDEYDNKNNLEKEEDFHSPSRSKGWPSRSKGWTDRANVYKDTNNIPKNNTLHTGKCEERDMVKTPKKENKKPTVKRIYHNFSKEFLTIQKENYPNLIKSINKSKITSSAETVDKLIRIDGYDFEFIKKVVLYLAKHDEFWSRNLLSLSTLRNKSKNNGEMKFTNCVNSYEKSHGNKSKVKPAKREWYSIYERKMVQSSD